MAGSGTDIPLKYELFENISICRGVRSPACGVCVCVCVHVCVRVCEVIRHDVKHFLLSQHRSHQTLLHSRGGGNTVFIFILSVCLSVWCKCVCTEGLANVVELIHVRSAWPDGLTCQHLCKHTP